MNTAIAQQVAKLSPQELGQLVNELLERLDPPQGAAITMAELDGRAERALANPAECPLWEEVEAGLQQ